MGICIESENPGIAIVPKPWYTRPFGNSVDLEISTCGYNNGICIKLDWNDTSPRGTFTSPVIFVATKQSWI